MWSFSTSYLKTIGPNSIKLGTNHPWVKGIQVCSNKGPYPLQRGDNHKNVKIGCGHLKIFFSTSTGPISTKLSPNHPWVKAIQVCSNHRRLGRLVAKYLNIEKGVELLALFTGYPCLLSKNQ